MEFCKRSGKILEVVKVSEKLGKFIALRKNVKRLKTKRKILMAYAKEAEANVNVDVFLKLILIHQMQSQ